jgi:hypothetical protein
MCPEFTPPTFVSRLLEKQQKVSRGHASHICFKIAGEAAKCVQGSRLSHLIQFPGIPNMCAVLSIRCRLGAALGLSWRPFRDPAGPKGDKKIPKRAGPATH